MSKASSIKYSAHMEVQSANPNWANQTEDELFKLSYVTPVKGEFNVHGQANHPDSTPPPYKGYACNMQPQVSAINSRVLSLSYKELQPGNPDLWDDHTNLISVIR